MALNLKRKFRLKWKFLTDKNVDVIYVCPVPVNEEKLQYYAKLMGLKTAIDSGAVEDQGDLSDRYKIIVPEAVTSFPVSGIGISTGFFQINK